MTIAIHFRGNNSPNIKSNILFLSLSNAASCFSWLYNAAAGACQDPGNKNLRKTATKFYRNPEDTPGAPGA